jgi:hypothetical protein
MNSPIIREMFLWALNNNHPILAMAKHLFKMGCTSNVPPEAQEITQPLPYQAVKSFNLMQK